MKQIFCILLVSVFLVGTTAFAGSITCKAGQSNSYDNKVQILIKTDAKETAKRAGNATITISKSRDSKLNMMNANSVYKRDENGITFLLSDKAGRALELHLSNYNSREGDHAVLLVTDSTDTTTQDLVCK